MWKNKAVNTDASAEIWWRTKGNERKRKTCSVVGAGGELAGGQHGRHTHASLLINYHRGWRGLRSHRCVFSGRTPPCQPPDPGGAMPWRCPPCQPVFSRAVNKEIDYQPVRKWQLDRGRSPWVTEGTIGSLQQQRRATRTVPTRGGKPAAGTATAFWSSSNTAAKTHLRCQSQSSALPYAPFRLARTRLTCTRWAQASAPETRDSSTSGPKLQKVTQETSHRTDDLFPGQLCAMQICPVYR